MCAGYHSTVIGDDLCSYHAYVVQNDYYFTHKTDACVRTELHTYTAKAKLLF